MKAERNERKEGEDKRQYYGGVMQHVNDRIVEVCAAYSTASVRREGGRYVFACPRCGKDTLQANPGWSNGPITGCWNPNCEIPRTADAIRFIAQMENLDLSRDFHDILRKGSEITAGPPVDDLKDYKNHKDPKKKEPSPNAANGSGQGNSQTSDTATNPANLKYEHAARVHQDNTDGSNGHHHEQGEDSGEAPELADAVYQEIMSKAVLSPEAWEGLQDRGLTRDTIREAGIGYLRADAGGALLKRLHEKFGEDLGRVPGFYENENCPTGYWSNFAGKELILFPYHDRNGLISTIEGRVMFGKEHETKYKYLSFTGSGSHIYVYPGMGFENIEAFCEGLVGAIVSAQEGICVASIQGFRRYRQPGGRYPLLALQGINFGGRTVAYIPDMDDPPNPEVAEEAPAAAHWLIAKQKGEPVITLLPSGKDLDEFLLTARPQHRRPAFDTLLARFSKTPAVYEEELAEAAKTKEAGEGSEAGKETNATSEQDHSAVANPIPETPHQVEPSKEAAQEPAEEHTEEHEDQTEDEDEYLEYSGDETGPDSRQQDGQDEDEQDHEDDEADENRDSGGTDNDLSSYLEQGNPAAGLTGEQFYREGFEPPEEPPDPKKAIWGTSDPRARQYDAVNGLPGDDSETKEKKTLKERLGDSVKYASRASRWALISAGAVVLKLAAIWAGLYIALRIIIGYLAPFDAPDGMWIVLAVTVVVCTLLRRRKKQRYGRFVVGSLLPGKKG